METFLQNPLHTINKERRNRKESFLYVWWIDSWAWELRTLGENGSRPVVITTQF